MVHKHSEVFFKETIEKSSAPLLIVDCKSGDVLYANQAAATLYGYPLDEFPGLGRTAISKDPAASQKALEERIPHSELALHLKKDGTVFPVEIFRSFFDIDGNPAAGLTIFDISERLNDARLLAEQEQRWAMACEASIAGVRDWDLRTNQVYRSPQLQQLMGYEADEIPSDPIFWASLVHPEDREGVLESRRLHFLGEKPLHTTEHRVRCKDGTYRWLLMRAKALRDESGAPYRMIGFLSDIQSLVDVREELQNQNRTLGLLQEISSSIIHSADKDREKVLSLIMHRAAELFGAELASLATPDPIGERMVIRMSNALSTGTDLSCERGQYLSGLAWETKEIQIKHQYQEWENRWSGLDAAKPQTMIAVPMIISDTVVGILSLGFLTPREFTEDELNILQQLSALAALVSRTAETDRKLDKLSSLSQRSSFLNMLVSGESVNREELARRAQNAGFSLKGSYVAISIEHVHDQAKPPDSYSPASPWLPFMDVIQQETAPSLVWERYAALNFLCPVDKDCTAIKQFTLDTARNIRSVLNNCLPELHLSVGIGNTYKDPLDIHRSFKEAREALDAGRRLGGGDGLYHYLDIGIVQMLARMGQQGPIRAFVNNTIGRLLEYDQRRKGQFLPTLEMILTGKSLRIISEEMNVHQKTIVFRKMRIEEILNLPIDEGDVRLNLSIALKLHKLAQSIEAEKQVDLPAKKNRKPRKRRNEESTDNRTGGTALS